jgi:uncharacterized protein YifE (UPF0438 family)
MKEKLILKHRGDFDYFLVSRTDNSEALVASLNPDGEFEYKLSKQNCDEIFGVIDVEEIADRHTFGQRNHEWKAYIAGFNKNAELNKDKVFTLEDMKKAYSQGELDALKTGSYSEKEKEFIQSLQQPTEIEVEIVMEDVKYFRMAQRPKLDLEGCLILKNI